MLAMPGAGSAAVINVPADHLTIQAAINAAVSGVDTIIVAPGSYPENLVLNKNLILEGAQAGVDARSRVVGSPNPAVETVIAPTTGAGRPLELQTGSAGSTIDGFAFVGSINGANGAVQSTS
ncbi:MAG TPA: hypothetical protein VNT79_01110, partial [Phycisphaerae bacterium]|nr:hypothetical protein [Phycisphaerae bacterium]